MASICSIRLMNAISSARCSGVNPSSHASLSTSPNLRSLGCSVTSSSLFAFKNGYAYSIEGYCTELDKTLAVAILNKLASI